MVCSTTESEMATRKMSGARKVYIARARSARSNEDEDIVGKIGGAGRAREAVDGAAKEDAAKMEERDTRREGGIWGCA